MTIVIHFDGLCEPVNPGGLGCVGYVVTLPDGCTTTGCDAIGRTYTPPGGASMPMTNNVAEYVALLRALERVRYRQGVGEIASPADLTIDIRGDSKLVVEQITERWACNKPHLIDLRDRIVDLLRSTCRGWTASWVPRDQNDKADRLSRQAYFSATNTYPPERTKR